MSERNIVSVNDNNLVLAVPVPMFPPPSPLILSNLSFFKGGRDISYYMVLLILYLCFTFFLIFVGRFFSRWDYLVIFGLGSSYVLLVVSIVYLRQASNLYNNKFVTQRKSLVAMSIIWSASELFCESQAREVVWWSFQKESLKLNSFMLLKFKCLKKRLC